MTHVAEFDAMLDGLPLLPRHVDILTTSAITAVAHLDAFFADVLERFEFVDDAELGPHHLHDAPGFGAAGSRS